MTQIAHSDYRDTDAHRNLLTVTGTAFEGRARLTGQINGKTVREETVFAVSTQEKLDVLVESMGRLLQRAATV